MIRIYPSKLLLFGEYTVLSGSQALAVPLDRWKGEWIKEEPTGTHEETPLSVYAEWLQTNDLISTVTANQILSDQREGLRFQSEIPIGYGLGSSGAYVAALYDRYINNHTLISSDSVLTVLARMEGYFHGSSSGMDPMVSFTNQAVYKDEKGMFRTMDDPGWPKGFRVFLLDSGISRSTGPLVQTYKSELERPGFKNKIERELIPMVEHAIHFYLSGTRSMLEECISVVSQFEREYFSMLIPEPIKAYWDQLSAFPGVYMKFCGAGGGGYFMVIATSSDFTAMEIPLIHVG